MSETINDELYKEIALELGISEKVVYDVIYNGQSKFTAFTITNNTFDGVRWPYMGSFKAKHKSIQILNHMKGLNPIQKEFFLQSLKADRFNELNDNEKTLPTLPQNGNGNKPV